MSFRNSVTVGPKFFAKAFNDYSNRYWAFAREVAQNSIDCGSTRVDVQVDEHPAGNATIVVVENNGDPMTRDVLVNKLLTLGESGKDFRGSVGGFGKAKEILYFAHREYVIVSGDLQVAGSGAGYNLEPAPHPCAGTKSVVIWDGFHASDLMGHFHRFFELCGTGPRVQFYLNGEQVKPKHAPAPLNRMLNHDGQDWAEVRLSNVEPGLLVVRVGGTPMFCSPCDYKGTVVLELTGTSAQRLTSNRDGLRYPYTSHLGALITSIAVDKRTVFKLEEAEYTRHAGPKLRRPRKKGAPAAPASASAAELLLSLGTAARVSSPEPMGGGGIQVDAVSRGEAPAGKLGHEFIVKNCVKKAVPAEYDPATFGPHAAWLARAWAGCLVELYDLYQVDEKFSVGFVFSDDVEAESERSPEYGQVYYLNPCKVTKKSHTRRFTKAGRSEVLADAAHEFVHGALNESYHGEDFANKLTEVMARVLGNVRRFTTHLK